MFDIDQKSWNRNRLQSGTDSSAGVGSNQMDILAITPVSDKNQIMYPLNTNVEQKIIPLLVCFCYFMPLLLQDCNVNSASSADSTLGTGSNGSN